MGGGLAGTAPAAGVGDADLVVERDDDPEDLNPERSQRLIIELATNLRPLRI